MKQVEIFKLDNELTVSLMHTALTHSYFHICQKFSPNRTDIDKSFFEMVNEILSGKFKHKTVIYRKAQGYELEHWEFGLSNNSLYLAVKVRPDLAENIFINFALTIEKC